MDPRGHRRRDDSEHGERRDYSRRSFDDDRPRFRGDSSDFRGDYRSRRENAGGGEENLPELYSICRARVHTVKPFGVFVRLEGCRTHGLVHLSQVSRHEVTHREDSDEVKIQALSAVAGQGDEVWVKIISLKHEESGGVKMGCSMKVVGQTDGRDLDPNNLQVELHESRTGHAARQKVTFDAVYDVECTRCGGHGHLKSECYSTGEKVYELLPEEDDDVGAQQQQPESNEARESSPKKEKEKSSKKRSKLPDSITTVEEAKALIASLKEEKKRKKKERKEDRDSKHHKKQRKERH